MLDIKINTKEIERVESMLTTIPNGIERAVSSTLNRTLTSTRASLVRRVRSQYDVKASIVRSSMTLNRARANNLNAKILSVGRTLPLIDFKVNPKKPSPRRRKPIFVSVKKTGGTIKGGFVAKMPNSHIGAFERVGVNSHPIKQLYGPSVPQMVGNDEILEGLSLEVEDVFYQRISHEAVRLLRRY